jgi:hypothetical protein
MRDSWTNDTIKAGFEQFRAIHGRLPTAPEIDKLDYLPSSRQIQRSFGGLEVLRETLGYQDIHFGKGVFRSKIATRSNIRGRETEIALEQILREKFGEVFVHTERIFDDSKNRVDFYIYSPDGNFGIDIFYTETMRDLQKNINLKIGKYKRFPCKLYLTVGNNLFSQSEIDASSDAKTKALPTNHTSVVNLDSLYKLIKPMRSYPNPIS